MWNQRPRQLSVVLTSAMLFKYILYDQMWNWDRIDITVRLKIRHGDDIKSENFLNWIELNMDCI